MPPRSYLPYIYSLRHLTDLESRKICITTAGCRPTGAYEEMKKLIIEKEQEMKAGDIKGLMSIKTENENKMTNDIEWKVKNMTLNRTCTPYDPPHLDVELEGVIKGPVVGSLVDITGELQEKLNKPGIAARDDSLGAVIEAYRAYVVGGRQNGKTLTQFKMYMKMLGMGNLPLPKIQRVIFNNPATIVIWADDTKTVVKAQNDELFDPEKGLAMAITKKALGNEGNYFDTIKKWVGDKPALKEISQEEYIIENHKSDREAACSKLRCAIALKKATKAELIAMMKDTLAVLGEGLDS